MNIVKSFSVGSGAMFYIKHNSDSFSIIDCCYDSDNAWLNQLYEINKQRKGRGICRFISTHPDNDHIKGLKDYNACLGITNFYCVKNEVTKLEETDDFIEYKKLRDDTEKTFYLFKGCSRKWLNCGDDERGSAGIYCLWPVIENQNFKEALEIAKKGGSPNNISPIITYNIENGGKFMWMGDLETSFLISVEKEIDFYHVDILFAPHHGRKSGHLPQNILDKITPHIIIVGEGPSCDLDYYSNYNTITQNLSGDIAFVCNGPQIDIYVENNKYSVKFLEDKSQPNLYGKYIGTLIS